MDYWRNLKPLVRTQKPVLRAFGEFIGQEGSLGLRRGQIEALSAYESSGMLWVYWDGGCCLYETLAAFRRNWKI